MSCQVLIALANSRSHIGRAEFRERTELLVMSALNILGHGAKHRSLMALTHISTAEVRKFFFVFLDAFMDMRDEYINLLQNISSRC